MGRKRTFTDPGPTEGTFRFSIRPKCFQQEYVKTESLLYLGRPWVTET